MDIDYDQYICENCGLRISKEENAKALREGCPRCGSLDIGIYVPLIHGLQMISWSLGG